MATRAYKTALPQGEAIPSSAVSPTVPLARCEHCMHRAALAPTYCACTVGARMRQDGQPRTSSPLFMMNLGTMSTL